MPKNPIVDHRHATHELAASLDRLDVYWWLLDNGYFPESYVLPPCFRVEKRPVRPILYYQVPKSFANRTKYKVDICECCSVHFPKGRLTDRTFGLIDPQIHNDIAFHIARHWKGFVAALFPSDSMVTSYSFPLPVDSRRPGRLGHLRSGRMIYEFLGMLDDDLASIAYRYSHLVRADIKNFYPSIYTHSIAWALHGKATARSARNDYRLWGNRLDRLFQNANDGCTNGIPIGPIVSDLIAELIASAVDVELSEAVREADVDCELVRFKDDYRIFVKREEDGVAVVKMLQAALKSQNLEINESKTEISRLPEGLFRKWASRYHAVLPKKPHLFTWKEFRELYLSVLEIDSDLPGTGVIDRFLADLVRADGTLRLSLWGDDMQKCFSMLLMLGQRRVKAFPKVIAIIEKVHRSRFGQHRTADIVAYLEDFLNSLAQDEDRNRFLIAWIGYFLVSNKLKGRLSSVPALTDPISKTVFNNRSELFVSRKDFTLFKGCVTVGKQVSMLEALDVFDPPELHDAP
jgi:hypothetical protein